MLASIWLVIDTRPWRITSSVIGSMASAAASGRVRSCIGRLLLLCAHSQSVMRLLLCPIGRDFARAVPARPPPKLTQLELTQTACSVGDWRNSMTGLKEGDVPMNWGLKVAGVALLACVMGGPLQAGPIGPGSGQQTADIYGTSLEVFSYRPRCA